MGRRRERGLTDDARALATLRDVFGHTTFRPLQRAIVDSILARRDTFVLLPTGGGKSLCYQLPALLMDGLAIVVSPLIALMKDQVDKLERLGVAATFVNSSLDGSEIRRRHAAIARSDVKLLYVAPERLAATGFQRLLASVPVAFFAIDEAHCISEWGHDFRPEYRALSRLRELFPAAPLAAFTATATTRVQADIATQLGLENAALFRGTFNRPNLTYAVRPKRSVYEQLRTYIAHRPEASGIVYCQARATTEDVADRLSAEGLSAAAYHAGLESDERRARQEAFIGGDVKVIVATIAFGMGIDKPDVRFVIHHDLPKNLEGYYQESGRAGRDGLPSECILFYSRGDAVKLRAFIRDLPAAQQPTASQQLRQMVEWAEASGCRRRALLAYFDEQLGEQPEPCCDVCQEPAELADYTVEAQKLLSCVKRTGERFGAMHVIDVLRGESTERVERLGHARLSTFGIGRDRSQEEWRHLARELIGHGYLRPSDDQYRTLTITARGNAALFARTPVQLPRPRLTAAPPRARTTRHDRAGGVGATPLAATSHAPETHSDRAGVAGSALFDQLRALRRRLADERGVPAYVVFPDSTLHEMAARLPADLTHLRQIHGVGPQKLRDFGEPFLALLARHAEGGSAAVAPASGPSPPRLL